MPTAAVTPETHNLTGCVSGENQTEPRVTGRLDAAGCLFLSIMPYGQAVPALICVFVLLTLFSCLVNVLTLLALARSEELSWQPRFTFLKSLILSDLIQTATFGPPVIHSLVQRRTMAFSTWCYVQYFVGSASIFTSLLTITCMALERYMYVCHAIHYLVILTQIRLRRVLTLIWVYSITIGVVNLALLHTAEPQDSGPVTMGLLCEPDIMEQHMGFPRASAIFRKVVGSLTLLLCLLIYLFSYYRMYQDARNAVIPFNTVNNTARKTVLFYCGMLLLQLLPLLLKVISDALWEVRGSSAMMERSSQAGDMCMVEPAPTATAALLHMSLLMMLIVPPCINPLVYGLRNVEMRKALLSLFQWLTEIVGSWVPDGDGDVVRQNRAQAG
ncbi:olfactory receptor 14A16 [Stegastes partitus]|uniref:Olfactory receptor 14A16 n=2 Tax=Stegastes partitus TaxID=144197 RepID=A0A9Y4KC20_9TELE|nr:PREDICTED: olfactory receptor 14A16-like [Stegastes partitus]